MGRRRQWLGLAICAPCVAAGCARHELDSAAVDAGAGGVAIRDGSAGVNAPTSPAPYPSSRGGGDASAAAPADARADGATTDASAAAPPANPGACVPPASPAWRLVAPVSGSTVTSARPWLRWQGDGRPAEIQICSDRACQKQLVLDGGDVVLGGDKSVTAPLRDLPAGYWFWRARAEGAPEYQWTPTWLFRVRRRAPGYAPQANTAVEPFSDYNGDGYPDFAINAGTTTTIYLGGADGIATNRVLRLDGPSIYTALSPYREPNADVNGDGFTDFGWKRDVAVPGQSWPIRIALIQFGSPAGLNGYSAIVDVMTDYYPLWVGEPLGLGDFDGDGYGDMFTTMRYGAAMLRGCAPAPAVRPWGTFACGDCQSQQIATGDFDGDGRSDVVFGDGSGITVSRGNPVGIGPVRIPGSSGYTIIDFNYDGYSDIVIRHGGPNAVLEAHEGGPGGVTSGLSAVPQPPPFVVAGDFDGDGWWDTIGPACTDTCPATMWVAYGGPAGWGAPPERVTGLDRTIYGVPAAVVDLNADGYDDLLVEGPGTGVTSFYAGSPIGLPPTPTRTVSR